MAKTYPFKDIENKWQKWWEANGVYHAKQSNETDLKKYYGLVEFPYPSGDGLHVGHPRSYTAIDIITRKKRMGGFNVMYPMGWDAFGLPAENFAIKKKVHPALVTEKNIATFKRQIQSLGQGFDWSREINTTDPAYYKWTQWMFIQFYESWFDESAQKAKPIHELHIPNEIEEQGEQAVRDFKDGKRMAFKHKTTINWCPKCKIGLANEEAQGGVCERCEGIVEKREKEQWMLRITKYADRLIKELDTVDYLDKIRTQQINWIGRSEGALIDFEVQSAKDVVQVFTTRPDTIFGATYLVLSPEHELVAQWIEQGIIKNPKDVQKYQEQARKKSDLERQENKEKTGVELNGVVAVNPANQKEIPIWIADYVLAGYGTGAIMAVPAHDERDFEFAKKFDLPIIKVIEPPELDRIASLSLFTKGELEPVKVESDCFAGHGTAINSDFLDGLETTKATKKIIDWLEKNKHGKSEVNFKLRDWVFSRQRYWGEPIPMVYCEHCGWAPVQDSELPVLLPDVEKYEPTDTGESPLAAIKDWVKTTCPICGADAERETDTMPNWAGSSWYFLRYCDPDNKEAFASDRALRYWMPVDLYNGGMEHTTLHLLYSRFWYKLLFDLGHIPESCGVEPYGRRRSHAMILGEGGVKMSKTKGNVINPDDVVGEFGADVFRCYEMFMGPYDMDAPWDTHGIQGIKRFLDKVWNLAQEQIDKYKAQDDKDESEGDIDLNYESILHKTIKKVSDDIENLHFNTAISQLMILTNELQKSDFINQNDFEAYLKILAPFAPHLTEELWQNLGYKESIHISQWPSFDEAKLIDDTVTVAVQINGKVRAQLTVPIEISEKEIIKLAKQDSKVVKYLENKEPKKSIYVKGKILNFVI